MWQTLSEPWQQAFRMAWHAYIKGCKPIGAVIVDEQQRIVAKGRNTINEVVSEDGYLFSTDLAHAEINALIKMNKFEHPNRRKYTLYSTLEPCPQCFGAMYMSGIRKLYFAGRDRFAGSTNLYGKTGYLSRKKLEILGPENSILETISIAFQVCHDLETDKSKNVEPLHKHFHMDSPIGVEMGRRWAENGTLQRYVNNDADISIVMEEVSHINRFGAPGREFHSS